MSPSQESRLKNVPVSGHHLAPQMEQVNVTPYPSPFGIGGLDQRRFYALVIHITAPIPICNYRYLPSISIIRLTFGAERGFSTYSDLSQASTTVLADSGPITREPIVKIWALLLLTARSAE